MFLLAGLLGLVFCLVETQSRGPIIAFGGAILLLLLGPVGGMSRRRRIAGMLFFAALFSVAMPGFFQHSSKRFQTEDYVASSDVRSRSSVWKYTRELIADHPFSGVGFGEQQFLRAMSKTDFRERYGEVSLDNPHNSYLQAAVYAGLPALFIFLLLNISVLMKFAIRTWRGPAPEPSTSAAFGIAVSSAGFLLCIIPDMHLFTPTVAPIYWLFFGLLTSMLSRPAKRRGPARWNTAYIPRTVRVEAAAQRDRLSSGRA
jgi:O-antigen ligase